jgi:hypothetical protein
MSDNAAFARVKREGEISYGIPCGTFATTTFAPHIHAPSDEAGLFDFDNMAVLVDYFTDMIIFLSKTNEEIGWTDDNFRRLS